MTERLYYHDAHATQFTAHVVERLTHEGRPALILDRTYFYPTGGGQPHDTGRINGVPVVDVLAREDDGAVLHLLAGEMPDNDVQAEIDWPRRLDHMQHHSGQHILTQAFIRVAGAHTVSFHLSEDSVTIDLDTIGLAADVVDAAETLANQIVTQNVPVRAWFPAPDELPDLALRKVPEVDGRLRVVAIGDFDLTACGGTHVAHSGEIGLIKVLKAERRGETTRVEFRCGARALRDYREKHALLSALAADLTTGYWEIGEALERLRAENRALRAELKAARRAVLAAEVVELRQAARAHGGLGIVARAWEGRDVAEVRALASDLVKAANTVALLGAAGEKAMLILARSADLAGPDMVAVLRRAMSVLTGGADAQRGGGRPDFAQGGGIPADVSRVQAALDEAGRAVREALALPGGR